MAIDLDIWFNDPTDETPYSEFLTGRILDIIRPITLASRDRELTDAEAETHRRAIALQRDCMDAYRAGPAQR